MPHNLFLNQFIQGINICQRFLGGSHMHQWFEQGFIPTTLYRLLANKHMVAQAWKSTFVENTQSRKHPTSTVHTGNNWKQGSDYQTCNLMLKHELWGYVSTCTNSMQRKFYFKTAKLPKFNQSQTNRHVC